MKVRLAKKIIKSQCCYWRDRRIDYGFSLLHPHVKELKKRPSLHEGEHRNEMEICKDRKAGMRRLISKKVYKVERLWCYNRFYNANITGLLYLETRKFLWWELSPILYIEVRVPYIEKPFYDGEYGTNVRLSSLEVEMRAEMEVIKDKFQRRLDRLIKQKSRA